LNWTRRTLPSRYRPALGVEAALEEIVKNKGRLYDPVVVEPAFAFSGSRDSLFRRKRTHPLSAGAIFLALWRKRCEGIPTIRFPTPFS